VSLLLRAVSKSYGGVRVLADVSLECLPGHVYLLTGGNGSGKSTLLDVISRITDADRGAQIDYDGRNLLRLSAWQLRSAGVARLQQHFGAFRQLTVRDNISLALRGGAPGGVVWTPALEMLRAVGLDPSMDVPARNLSFGQARALAIAMTILTDVGLYLLDEPTAGLAPAAVGTLADVVAAMKARARCVIVVEHRLLPFEHSADQYLVMKQGRLTVSDAANGESTHATK